VPTRLLITSEDLHALVFSALLLCTRKQIKSIKVEDE
jgi:hypothetical protein